MIDTKVYKIEYVDALYFTGQKFSFNDFKVHVALGKIIKNETGITVIFKIKNNKPFMGLVLPVESTQFNEVDLKNKSYENMEIGTGLGIYWDDIVFFDNGKLPKQPTEMYTEGKIHKITKNAIIISNPITIKIKKKLENHPQQKATYAAIPFNLIKSVDKYE